MPAHAHPRRPCDPEPALELWRPSRGHPAGGPAGTPLVVQRVERFNGSFLYEVWCTKAHALKTMTQEQIEAMIPATGTPTPE